MKNDSTKQKFVFQWHITHKCNLRCSHCYQEDYTKDLNLKDLTNIFNQIIDYTKEKNCWPHINFTGGEPFVSENVWSLFDKCDENNVSFGILTNGTLVDEETVCKLSTYKRLRFVQVSLDGTEQTHDAIRGAGSFSKTMESLRLLKKAKIQTMVSFTCTKSNYKELKDVIKVCKKVGVDRFWTDRLIPMGSNKLDIVSTDEYMEYLKVLGRESKKAKWNPFTETRVHTNRALQFVCGCEESCYQCSAGKNLLTILADGTLLPCRRLPLELGSLKEKSIKEIVECNETVKELRKAKLPFECQSCKNRCHCRGGAKCLTYAVTGKLDEKDINCPLEKG